MAILRVDLAVRSLDYRDGIRAVGDVPPTRRRVPLAVRAFDMEWGGQRGERMGVRACRVLSPTTPTSLSTHRSCRSCLEKMGYRVVALRT